MKKIYLSILKDLIIALLSIYLGIKILSLILFIIASN